MKQTIVNNLLKRLFLLSLIIISIISCSKEEVKYQKLQGNVFGTTFHVQYSDTDNINYSADITSLFDKMNKSLSTYHSNSLISQLNDGLSVLKVDSNFVNVFKLSKKIFKDTDGYFDPTVGKMVNAWGFGPHKSNRDPSKNEIDSLMSYVGFDKVSLKGDTIVKQSPNITFDFNATAKGYGVDLVGEFLESKGIKNYLIEIGGEIRARGKNEHGKYWSIGIEEPNFDGTRSLQKVTTLDNEAIATSGNYRKFRIDSITGQKIAHTFNPKTGSPAHTDLLSASVIAPVSCGEVDAYATAFMAMGYEKAKTLAKKHKNMKVYFIYIENDQLKTYASDRLEFVE
ncbi:FAD:protein FMN transferase [Wenyingzhuangia marina]|uniref:FAD:protein FMN transferase n=1 Tax=Wenyingzhuangia marina TaxID=1195760 RepID=A0A1M5T0N8_9FLAO|nr:FAD:protein FMN transferase [Wenyingzhuangia marina]SHH44170.1 thiamine biosynthesis lipoprotein [Wenyingzhuangia marina]